MQSMCPSNTHYESTCIQYYQELGIEKKRLIRKEDVMYDTLIVHKRI